MSDTITVETRGDCGKRNSRRLRRSGKIPAILYGRGAANINLSLPQDQLAAVIRHGGRLIELKGAVQERAFLRAMQWDTYGTEILHVDLSRISENEKVQVRVAVELRGAAAGVREGGVIDHHLHELEIECPVIAIPERIQINVNDLHLGQSLKISDLHLPEGVRALGDADEIVVACVEPRAESEVSTEATGAEPELIGRKAEADEETE